jgi:hypothetical protein
MGSYGDNYGSNYDVAQVQTSGHQHRPSIPFIAAFSPIKVEPREPEIIQNVLTAQGIVSVLVNSFLSAKNKASVLANSFLKVQGECKLVDPTFKLSELKKGKASSHGYEVTAKKEVTQAELEEIAMIAEIAEVFDIAEGEGLI